MIYYSERGWKYVGKIKRSDMKSVKDPISKLHKKLKEFFPEGKSISQFGMGTKANEYFAEQVTAAVKRQYSGSTDHHIAQIVGWALLDAQPCDIEGVEGFEVYIRNEIEEEVKTPWTKKKKKK
jgi:hypothetical protein